MILCEFLRILSSEKFVQVLSRVGDLLITCIKKFEGIHLDDCLYIRHFSLCKTLPDDVIHKEDLSLGVVYKMVYVARLEFVEKRHRNCSVSECRKESHSPVSLVS